MPKINVYLPQDLAEAVRSAGFAVSPVCQKALADAVQSVGVARRAAEWMRQSNIDPQRFPSVWDRLENRMTPRLKTSTGLAQQAAHGGVIETRHLLIGVLDQGDNLALRLLEVLDVDIERLRANAETSESSEGPGFRARMVDPQRGDASDGHVAIGSFWFGLSLPSRRAFAAALDVSVDMGHNYLGCEHLLLGLIEQEDSGAGLLLKKVSVDRAGARRAIEIALAGYGQAHRSPPSSPGMEEVLQRLDAIERRLSRAGV
jgi:ATP-dependent Clp protease ATP-binding subunit ClpA